MLRNMGKDDGVRGRFVAMSKPDNQIYVRLNSTTTVQLSAKLTRGLAASAAEGTSKRVPEAKQSAWDRGLVPKSMSHLKQG